MTTQSTTPSAADILADMEKALRSPDLDASYVLTRLKLLVDVLDRLGSKGRKSAIFLAALSGVAFYTDRLLALSQDTGGSSIERLKDVFAGVELKSYSDNSDTLESDLQKFRKEYTMVGVVSHPCLDGVTRHAYVSALKQTTQDGRVFDAGEMIESFQRPVSSWNSISQHLFEQPAP